MVAAKSKASAKRKTPDASDASVKREAPSGSKCKSEKADTSKSPIPASKIMGAMPSLPKDGSNPQPVWYKKGVIYTSRAAKKFRALSTRGDRYSESSRAWGGSEPTKAAWKAAVKTIGDQGE